MGPGSWLFDRPGVLVGDEVGYLTYGSDDANVLFNVVRVRHRKKCAVIFTPNDDLDPWGHILRNDDLAAAIVDRVLECGRHFNSTVRRFEQATSALAERTRHA